MVGKSVESESSSSSSPTTTTTAPPRASNNPNSNNNTTIVFGNDTDMHLGVIVDRTSFDGEDDWKDIPQLIEEGQRSLSEIEGHVMRNGKVKRRLRWKPPNFRKKKSSKKLPSSNSSVISALTNKSTSTNRSTSTNKSFLSHFSRKSQNSFHTFHSTETPVVTNKAGRPMAPHTIQRPNYQDTFESRNQPATIDNDGKGYMHTRRTGSGLHLGTVDESGDFERSSTLPSRLDGMNIPPRINEKRFDPYGGSGDSVGMSLNSDPDPFDALDDVIVEPPPTVAKKSKKAKRPPLFKRKLRKSNSNSNDSIKERTPEECSLASLTNNSSGSPVAANPTAPTLASSSGSPLDSVVSLEREPSVLPVLEAEDFEQDRRVFIGTSPRREQDYAAEDGASEAGDSACTPLHSTTPEHPQPSPDPSQDTVESAPSRRASPHRPYNRPVDRTMQGDVITTSSDCEIETQVDKQQQQQQQQRRATPSVPVDLDDGAFLEAEHNLRAIHEMAAEHLAHEEFEEAIEVFEEILRAQKERYGQEHYRVGTALHNLGVVHLKRRDYTKAIAVFREAVEVRQASLVPNHPDVAISLAQLGVANLESGKYEMSLLPFREALNIRRTFLGSRHPKCSKLLNNIGCALYSLDELDDARTVFQEALGIQRDTLRLMPSSEEAQESYAQSNNILLSMASTLCNLGSINLKKGQFEEAGVALEEALLVSL
jgi:tetratricopeptide (TPR) repeat protein